MFFGDKRVIGLQKSNKRAPVDTGPTKSDIENNQNPSHKPRHKSNHKSNRFGPRKIEQKGAGEGLGERKGDVTKV